MAEKAIETTSPDEQLLVDIVRTAARNWFDHKLRLKTHAQEVADAAMKFIEAIWGLQVYSHKLSLCAKTEAHEEIH